MITWKEALINKVLPAEFIQWVVQREGPLPEGPIQQAEYERLASAYELERKHVGIC